MPSDGKIIIDKLLTAIATQYWQQVEWMHNSPVFAKHSRDEVFYFKKPEPLETDWRADYQRWIDGGRK